MRRFVESTDRGQSTLFPECLEDWISEDNPVRVIDVFVDELDLAGLGCRARGNRPTFFSSIGPAEALHLRLPQSGPVDPAEESEASGIGDQDGLDEQVPCRDWQGVGMG
jgi:hypothetical protein